MKIAIFTISLGKYNIFFNELYSSVNNYFLPSHEKHFFVFTDKEFEIKENLTQINQQKLGWPYDTMMRFHFMNKIKDQLSKYDYIFFFNINMKVLEPIGDEILPGKENDYLMGCEHPLHYNWLPFNLPYERNKLSTCFIDKSENGKYHQGCFNGGRSKEFLEMSEILEKNIDIDVKNNVIPIWHDESMLNWYYQKKKPLTMDYSYIYPESLNLPLKKIMIQRDKWKYMNKEQLRN